jgi:hypothetical protein
MTGKKEIHFTRRNVAEARAQVGAEMLDRLGWMTPVCPTCGEPMIPRLFVFNDELDSASAAFQHCAPYAIFFYRMRGVDSWRAEKFDAEDISWRR